MNKTEQVYQDLRIRIEKREFVPGSRFPSEYRLAEEYGVDKKTANAAVSRLVADGFLKRGVRGAGTAVLKQVVFPRGYLAFVGTYSVYNTRILNGVQQTASGAGYAVIVLFSDEARIRLQLEALTSPDIKGIITAGYAGLLTDSLHLPVVQVDIDLTGEVNGVCINTDNRQGAYDLMREILRRGHRHILLYCGGRPFQVRRDRIAGFLDAMREQGIPRPEERLLYGAADSVPHAGAFLQKLRTRFPETTLVACDGDDTAQSLLTAALEQGIKIPEDLCVTSYGNTLTPVVPCAGVEQYPEKIGALACARILDSMESGEMPSPGMELVKPDITGVQFIPDLTV